MTERCQVYAREGKEQCRLPAGHRCTCLFTSEPLSLIQGLAWREEVREQAKHAHNEAIELAARMAHRAGDDALVERIRNLKRDP